MTENANPKPFNISRLKCQRRKCQTPSKRRTDGQTRTATTSTAIAAVTPCRRHCDSSTVSRHKRADGRTDRRRESNFVHYNLKTWQYEFPGI